MKFIKLIAIVLAFGLIFAGCSMIEVNEVRDRETVIAKVGDEVVLKGEFQDVYNMYEAYGYYPENFSTDPEQKETYIMAVEELIDSMVDTKVLEITAFEKGCYEFSLEDRKELDEDIADALDTYVNMYTADLVLDPVNAELSEEELKALALENIDTYLTDFNVGFKKQDVIDDYETSKAQEVLYDLTTASVTVTEDELKTWYEFLVENAKTSYESGYASFESDASSTDTLYYVPENVRMGQHILITLPEDMALEVQELQAAGEIDLAKIKLDEALRAIEGAANEAYDRAVAGEDFVLLMQELGEDPGMTTYEYYTVMYPSQNYVAEFAEGLFALENVGDISEPVATAFGYHIIKYYGDMESGPVSYDEIHDDLYNSQLEEKQDIYFTEQIAVWKESIDVKTYYNRAMN